MKNNKKSPKFTNQTICFDDLQNINEIKYKQTQAKQTLMNFDDQIKYEGPESKFQNVEGWIQTKKKKLPRLSQKTNNLTKNRLYSLRMNQNFSRNLPKSHTNEKINYLKRILKHLHNSEDQLPQNLQQNNSRELIEIVEPSKQFHRKKNKIIEVRSLEVKRKNVSEKENYDEEQNFLHRFTRGISKFPPLISSSKTLKFEKLKRSKDKFTLDKLLL